MINIFGPPTAGKSTIAKMLREHVDRLYTVDFDVVKHQLAGYDWKRDKALAEDITFDTLISASKTGVPIVVLLPLQSQQDAYERIASAAKNEGYELVNIEIRAPEEVLVSRYKDRLTNIEDPKIKEKMKNIEELKTYIRTPYFRPDNTTTFDSSHNTPDEIFAAIKELVGIL